MIPGGFLEDIGVFMLIIIILFIVGLYFLYCYAFGRDDKRLPDDDEIPKLELYEEYRELIAKNIKEIKEASFERVRIRTKDRVCLYGRYYHRVDNAPIMIMFHGYRGSALRDGMGAFKFSEENGFNLLMVDQRGHRESGGKTITFGVRERYDCLEWINYILSRFGKQTEIFLIGLSMGASTVLMATGLELPENVKGVIADCGYSAPKDILMVVIRMMKLPEKLAYFAVRMSAKVFGGFDPEAASATEALSNCKVPILFIHGEDDSLVPCEMSRANFKACVSEKEIFTVPVADHGMSYLLDENGYKDKVYRFLKRNLSDKI